MSQCPFHAGQDTVVSHPVNGVTLEHWWPNRLKIEILHQHSAKSNPMGADFNYIEEFNTLNLDEVKADIKAVMVDSKDWWPADYGHYGPLFIRMAWHDAGTYRISDGRGGANTGNQRFAPINSWPDNVNLDKARRLLWPVKQKYGRKLSWADLIIFAGTIALEDMGLPIVGFAGGREDIYAPETDVYWGVQKEWAGDNRNAQNGKLDNPLAAVVMGLIYVNPEGPLGKPDPIAAAEDIRVTFSRMAMNDEETVALIAGGHTFGKTHGAGPASHVGAEPEAAAIEQQGLGWQSSYKSGKGTDAITSGLEVTWTNNPIAWDMGFFENLFKYEWVLEKSPAGAWQWVAAGGDTARHVPDAFDKNKLHRARMLTTDLSLIYDPEFRKISEDFVAHPDKFAKAFARAWFKLTHRDLGPKSRYYGSQVPQESFIWQDNVPRNTFAPLTAQEEQELKALLQLTDLTVSQLVSLAWASAATYRGSDYRGGANGGRIRLAPQKDWEVNRPEELAHSIAVLEKVQAQFSGKVSFADLVVLAGSLGVELAAKAAGYPVTVPVSYGRGDATQQDTDVHSFAALEPIADAFRNYSKPVELATTAELLIDKAQLLTLSAPEMTVLLAGMRVLDTNFDGSKHGVFTDQPGVLSTDFFVNLLDMNNKWEKVAGQDLFNLVDRTTGTQKFTATAVDLIFGANSQLRALAEVYGASDAKEKFVTDFVKAWVKVMNLDRFDLHK